jgi:hypothetical protein
MLRSDQSNVARQSNINQRHPAFSVSNDKQVTSERTPKAQETIMSPAVRQLNRDGFVVYNVPERQDVYISIKPDTAFFDEDEPEMVKMESGSFVGSGEKRSTPEIMPKRVEPISGRPVNYTQASDIFVNAGRREALDEIDFNEIIIKSNDNFEEELEAAPLFDPTGGNSAPFREVNMISSEFREQTVVPTSTAPVEEYRQDTFVEYYEEPAYEVKVVSDAPVEHYVEVPMSAPIVESYVEVAPLEHQTVMSENPKPFVEIASYAPQRAYIEVDDTPEGLYVEGHENNNSASMEMESDEELFDFTKVGGEGEVALTSEAETRDIVFMDTMIPEAEEAVLQEEVLEIPEEIPGTVASNEVFEIDDPVADILKLTVPQLYWTEEIMADADDVELSFPDDGLESYDEVFRYMEPAAPVEVSSSVSFGFNNPTMDIMRGPSVNFRF